MTLLTQADTIKRNWLCSLILVHTHMFLSFSFRWISRYYNGTMIIRRTRPSLKPIGQLAFEQLSTTLALLFVTLIVLTLLRYHCNIKKPGTKWLMLNLCTVPLSILIIIFLLAETPIFHLVFQLVVNPFCVYTTFKLYRLNKERQAEQKAIARLKPLIDE